MFLPPRPFNYNHMVLAPNSTMYRAFIDLDVLKSVLDSFWDGRPTTLNQGYQPGIGLS